MAQFPDEVTNVVQAAAPDTPIIVDFDETLFLQNSTQEYLSSVYPRPAGALFVTLIEASKPWRLFPGALKDASISRDWFLVVAATVIFPWTWLVWRWRAKRLAKEHCNRPLAEAIDANSEAQLVITTLGFDVVVNPLIRHLPMNTVEQARYQVVACRFWRGALDRIAGKLTLVKATIGKNATSRAIFITQSETEAALLDAVAVPCLLSSPEAKFVPAFSDVYIPLFYAEKVKNPGKAHFIKQVLLGHWAFGVIAWSCASPHPVVNAVSLLLLTLSYWCVYELGYRENDVMAESHEAKPTLSAAYANYKEQATAVGIWPWVWAIALALPGCWLFELSTLSGPIAHNPWMGFDAAFLRNSALWLVYLLVIRVSFRLYNRLNESTRIWLYPVLQVQKMFGFALLASVSLVGAILLLSFSISRWVQYCVYRCGGDRTQFPVNVSCVLVFSLLYGLLLGTEASGSLLTWQAAIAFGYCALRSLSPLKKIISAVRWLPKSPHDDSGDPADKRTQSQGRNKGRNSDFTRFQQVKS